MLIIGRERVRLSLIMGPFLCRDQIDWSSEEAAKEIKPRRRLFNYAMTTVLDAIRQMKIRLNEETRTFAVFNDVAALAKYKFVLIG